MNACTQNTDRECREEDCCLNKWAEEQCKLIDKLAKKKLEIGTPEHECQQGLIHAEKIYREKTMKKKTRLIPFDYEKFKAGAKAKFRNFISEIIGIFESDNCVLENKKYLIVYKNSECKVNTLIVYSDALLLEIELEEKTFYVNVYKNAVGNLTHNHIESARRTIERERSNYLGILKVTYTEEDLIK